MIEHSLLFMVKYKRRFKMAPLSLMCPGTAFHVCLPFFFSRTYAHCCSLASNEQKVYTHNLQYTVQPKTRLGLEKAKQIL